MRNKKAWSWLILAGLGLVAVRLISAIAREQARPGHAEGGSKTQEQRGSFAYRIARRMGIVLPARFGEINLASALSGLATNYYRRLLDRISRFSILFGPFSHNVARPQLLRLLGCTVGQGVFIGDDVLVDRVYPEMITIEDRVFISSRCILTAHQRDLAGYQEGVWIGDCDFSVKPIHIGKGAHIGMGSVILPGVSIGAGAIVGAGSVVANDVPPYSVAVSARARAMPLALVVASPDGARGE